MAAECATMAETRRKFDDLFCDLLPRLYRGALVLTSCRPTAEDALHDTYLKLVANPERLTDHPLPYAYAFAAMVSVLRDGWRRRRREILHADPAELTAGGCDDDGVQAWEAQRETVRLLARLTARQAAIVLLVDVEGHSIDQAAEILGVHRGTVARARGRALVGLRSQLIQEPFSSDSRGGHDAGA